MLFLAVLLGRHAKAVPEYGAEGSRASKARFVGYSVDSPIGLLHQQATAFQQTLGVQVLSQRVVLSSGLDGLSDAPLGQAERLCNHFERHIGVLVQSQTLNLCIYPAHELLVGHVGNVGDIIDLLL